MKKKTIISKISILYVLSFFLMSAMSFWQIEAEIKKDIDDTNENESLRISGYWDVSNINIDDDGGTPGFSTWSYINATFPWCNGNGSWINPYIIENVIIDGEGSPCVEIFDSSVFFVFRNCTFYNSGFISDIVTFNNVANGTLDYCNISQAINGDGIFLLNSENNTVSNSYFDSTFNSINIRTSDNITILNNIITSSDHYGIYAWDNSNNITILSNNIDNTEYGIRITTGYDNLIENNNISDSNRGIFITLNVNNTIINNTIHDTAFGIECGGSDFNKILLNTLYENSHGIYLDWSENTTIEMNEISNNSLYGIRGLYNINS